MKARKKSENTKSFLSRKSELTTQYCLLRSVVQLAIARRLLFVEPVANRGFGFNQSVNRAEFGTSGPNRDNPIQ